MAQRLRGEALDVIVSSFSAPSAAAVGHTGWLSRAVVYLIDESPVPDLESSPQIHLETCAQRSDVA